VVNVYVIITTLSLYNQGIESLWTERSRTIFTDQNSWSRWQRFYRRRVCDYPL